MQKGEVIHGYVATDIHHNIGQFQDKYKHKVFLSNGKDTVTVEELSVTPTSNFTISKAVPFVVVSVGNGGKLSWVKVDEDYLKTQQSNAGSESQKLYSDKDYMYIAKESMAIAANTSTFNSVDDLVSLALGIGKGMIDNAEKLKKFK